MARAILLVGNENRFMNDAIDISGFLQGEAGITDVKILEAWRCSPKEIMTWLIQQDMMTKDEVVLLGYFGHGIQKGWNCSTESFVPYELLCMWLSRCRNRIVVVNAACYAHALAGYLRTAHVDKARVGLISASSGEDLAYGNVLPMMLIDYWGRKQKIPESTVLILENLAMSQVWIDFSTNPLSALGSLWGRFHLRVENFLCQTETDICHILRWGYSPDRYFFRK